MLIHGGRKHNVLCFWEGREVKEKSYLELASKNLCTRKLITAHFRPKVRKQSEIALLFDGLVAEDVCSWLDEENEAIVVIGQWWPLV